MKHRKLIINPVKDEQYRQNGVDLILADVEGRPPVFVKGAFYLGATAEHLELPDDLMAFVCLRSTWARQGILIPPTIVDAGFKGNLTLEIVAHKSIDVPYGERFAHLIFAKMSSFSIPYDGKYQGQSGITPGRKDV